MARREDPRLRVNPDFNERLRPAASPVDTFVRTSEGSSLAEIASALSSLSPVLNKYANVRAEKEAVEQRAQGRMDELMAATGTADPNEASRKRAIPGNANPHYVAARMKTRGSLAADEAQARWIGSPEYNALLETGDIGKLAEGERAFKERFLAETYGEEAGDSFFVQGFASNEAGHRANNLRSYGTVAGQMFEKKTVEDYTNRFVSLLTPLPEEDVGIGEEREENFVTGIKLAMDEGYAAGIPGDALNRAAVDAIVTVALRDNDPAILDLLKGIETNGGANLFGTAYGAAQYAKAKSAIRTEARQADAELEANNVKAIDAEATAWIQSVDDATLRSDEGLAKLAEFRNRYDLIGGPGTSERVALLMKARLGKTGKGSDPDLDGIVIMNSFGRFAPGQPDYMGPAQIDAAYKAGRISDSVYSGYYSRREQRAREAKENQDGIVDDTMLTDNRVVKDTDAQIRGRFPRFSQFDSPRAVRAARDGSIRMAQWLAANPKAPQHEVLAAQEQIITSMVERYNPTNGADTAAPADALKRLTAQQDSTLRADLQAIREGRTDALSRSSTEALFNIGVDANDPAAILKFIEGK